jgi:malate synthase
MRATVSVEQLKIDKSLYDFVCDEALAGTGVQARDFWSGFAALVRTAAPRNAALMRRRDELQAKIDAWHRANPGPGFDPAKYRTLLGEIGYLVAEQEPFAVSTANVDAEIAQIAGPQLVVPVSNARYALNAANARWGSLYDALYGTDAIPENGAPRGGKYNPHRGSKVIGFVRDFLDEHFALAEGSHRDALNYSAANHALEVKLKSGKITRLRDPSAFRGFQGGAASPTVILLIHNGLHVELHVDRTTSAATTRPASATWCWNRPSRPSRTARIRSPRSMRMTRSTSTETGWD